jgi:hypothetical protein
MKFPKTRKRGKGSRKAGKKSRRKAGSRTVEKKKALEKISQQVKKIKEKKKKKKEKEVKLKDSPIYVPSQDVLDAEKKAKESKAVLGDLEERLAKVQEEKRLRKLLKQQKRAQK